jgi:hypothetical protein
MTFRLRNLCKILAQARLAGRAPLQRAAPQCSVSGDGAPIALSIDFYFRLGRARGPISAKLDRQQAPTERPRSAFPMSTELQALASKVAQLEQRLGILEDVQAVRKLQYAYGYFIDKCMYNETVDLFADDGEVRFLGGRYKGKAGVRRLYIERFQKLFTGGKNGPVYGFLLDHPQIQDIIDIAPDRKTARARARSMMQAGRHESAPGPKRAWWEGGTYENEYVKENGVWKIKVLNYNAQWRGNYEHGWAHEPIDDPIYKEKDLHPNSPIGPDELIQPPPVFWPQTEVVPFHYPHPVTGKPIKV